VRQKVRRAVVRDALDEKDLGLFARLEHAGVAVFI
jgi:hypothetical protein